MTNAGQPPPAAEPPAAQSRTSEQYTKSLHQACTESLQTDLFSRIHYQFLSHYLKSTSRYGPPTHGPDRRASVPASQTHVDRFTYVVVHTISNGTIKRHDFDHKLGLDEFWAFPEAEPNTDQVIFVRGSLSPAWLELLGAKYKVDPEFFRRHLQYLSQSDYSDLPPLPSASTNSIFLPVTSLYTRSLALSEDQVRRQRNEDNDIARNNQQAIRQKATCGESVIRNVSTLSDRLLSIEHDISIYIRERKNGSRLAIVFLDNGLNLNRSDGPPCFSRHNSQIKNHTVHEISLNPILIPRPNTVHISVEHPKVPEHDRGHANHVGSFCNVMSLLPFHFGMSLNQKTLSHTPRPEITVLLMEVFQLVASSECQFLNRVYGVAKEQRGHSGDERRMEPALNTLVYIKTLLDEHRPRLQQTMTFLSCREISGSDPVSSTRVPCTTGTSQCVPQGELSSIYADFEDLLSRNKSLGDFCVESMDLIMNTALLKESRKAFENADDQKRLMILAYFFLPLSLVSSIFGMNVKEFGTGSQHIWLPVVVLVPIILFALTLSHPHYFKPLTLMLTKPWRPKT
ncbi:hypothetical protein VE03_05375 [Pseudogymnoascus sp. 23342-1-I1]|nr:hypothetical protein VE03_05375 [Pseudogymnoascus sp. 23342-1-I1]